MTREEAISIKHEILRKEGSIHICNAITIDGVVLIKDVLDIINKYEAGKEAKDEQSSRLRKRRT